MSKKSALVPAVPLRKAMTSEERDKATELYLRGLVAILFGFGTRLVQLAMLGMIGWGLAAGLTSGNIENAARPFLFLIALTFLMIGFIFDSKNQIEKMISTQKELIKSGMLGENSQESKVKF